MRLGFIALLMTAVATSPAQADWPQFRGPTGQGVAAGIDLPLTWTEQDNVRWRTDVPGKGWSSPVVLGDRVWLTTAVNTPPTDEQIARQFKASGLDEEKFGRRQVAGNVSCRVMCLDLAGGDVLHDVEVFDVDSPRAVHIGNSYASPTPVIEPGRLYCHFDAGTACIDTDRGEVLWRRTIPVFYSVGAGSSPVVYKNLLVLICDGVDKQFVIALDKYTGETVWQTERPPYRTDDGQHRKAFSTPLLVHAAGRDQLIVPGAQWLVSYDGNTGKEIWRVDHGTGFSTVPRPVFGHGLVYMCTGFASKELWAVRVDGLGDVTDTHVAWVASSQIPTNPSPVLVGDLLLVISDTGIATCFDATTGRAHWKQRIGGNHSASPVGIGDRIYFFSQEGEVTVVRAAKEFVELAKTQVGGRLMASPAVAASTLILRTDTALIGIGRKHGS